MLIKKKRIPIKEIITIGILPSFLKILVYKLKGYNIGKKVSIGFGSVIIGEKVTIKDSVSIGLFTIVRGREITMGRFVKIGSVSFIDVSFFEIGDDSRINEQVYVGGLPSPTSELRIGKRCLIMQMCFINPTKPIKIGDDVGIGGDTHIFTHASRLSVLEGFPAITEPITINNNVWIAWKVFIMPGVKIGENSTIGPNVTVNVNIAAHSLVSSAPMRVAVSGRGKWPRVPSEKSKIKMLHNINSEFIEYLNFNGFKTELIDKVTYKKIEVSSYSGSIYFGDEGFNYGMLNSKDICVSFFEDKILNGNFMLLNFKLKKRRGTNLLGEEYVRFLSRYGIRFDRLD